MVINGDIARLEGKPGDYEAVTGYIDPIIAKIPLAITMGNHDDRKNCRSALATLSGDVQPVEKKFVMTVDTAPIEFIFLDSLLATNVIPGQLGKSQREWLQAHVKTAAKPIVIFVHHDPDVNDDNGLVDAAQLLDVAMSTPAIKAVFFGHTHAWRHETVKGLHLINIPAVGFNFKDSEPVGWTDARFRATGADLQLNAIAGNMARNGERLKFPWR
jgi:3',5'-cyclic AMP phosphodiesterase CpdA